jgi:hypothetical protein
VAEEGGVRDLENAKEEYSEVRWAILDLRVGR